MCSLLNNEDENSFHKLKMFLNFEDPKYMLFFNGVSYLRVNAVSCAYLSASERCTV